MRTLLGVVTGTKPDKYGERIAWLKPLFDVTSEPWEEADPLDFPSRGSLFWPRASDAVKDTLVFVRAKENSVPQQGGDEFMVVEPQNAFEVVDLRSIGSCEQVRIALSNGISLPAQTSSRMLLWCSNDLVVGPVSLIAGTDGLITVEKNNLARISCFQLKPGGVRQVLDGMTTRFVIAKPSLGSPDRFVDWDDDRRVVRRAIEYAVDLARTSKASLDFPKQLIEEAAEQLSKRSASADFWLELYRLERARSLAGNAAESAAIADEVVAALRRHPVVLKEIDQIKASERESARSAAEVALKSERDALDRIKKERIEAESALADAQKTLTDTEVLVNRQADEAEGKIRGRIAEALSNAPGLLAEIAVLKPFLGTREVSPSLAPEEIKLVPWRASGSKLSTVKELRARAIPAFKALGVPTAMYQPVHAAFASGLMPVLTGSRAMDALCAYAHVATSGRIATIQATTSFAEAQDLFGRVDVRGRRFVPHAAGLIDIVRAARKSDGLMLVVIDGANRGATESYLLPLLRAVLRKGCPISLFHPGAVSADDPYRSDARIEWPRNLLLAATLVEGPTTLPVAPDVWNDSALIQVDLEEAPPSSGLDSEPSEFDPASVLLRSAIASEAAHADWLDGIARSGCLREVGTRFAAALRAFVSDESLIQQGVTKAVLVPFFASMQSDDDRLAAMKALEKSLSGKGRVALGEWIQAARRTVA